MGYIVGCAPSAAAQRVLKPPVAVGTSQLIGAAYWAERIGVAAPHTLGSLSSLHVHTHMPGLSQISVTSGVVSRIEVTAYAHGATELLGVQIDAAINSGNSGG